MARRGGKTSRAVRAIRHHAVTGACDAALRRLDSARSLLPTDIKNRLASAVDACFQRHATGRSHRALYPWERG